jgi:O-antigen ligase
MVNTENINCELGYSDVQYVNSFCRFLISLVPVMAMLAGLSLGFLLPIAFLCLLLSAGPFWRSFLRISPRKYKLELALLFYTAFSIFWTLKPMAVVPYYLLLLFISCASLLIYQNLQLIRVRLGDFSLYNSIGLFCAIAIFFIEYFTGGIINSSFRELYETTKSSKFFLHYLDRGCIFLSLFTWVVIANYIQKGKWLLACVIYFLMLYMLYISDSLSGFLGFAAAGIVAVFFRFVISSSRWQFYIYSFGMLIFIAIFMLTAYFIDARQVNDEYDFLPLSAKHRVFIWNYVAHDKIPENVYLGHGYHSSRFLVPAPEQIVIYKDVLMSPLPVHPHNHILQVFLEGGVISLILYIGLMIKLLSYIANHGYELWQRAVFYAAFTSFFIVSMIAYSMWQPWWLCSYIWCLMMLIYNLPICNVRGDKKFY